MRTSRSMRGRRRAPRRSFASHTRGRVILAMLTLAAAPLALYAPWLRLLADAEPVVEFAGRTVAGLLGPALLAGLVWSAVHRTDDRAVADLQVRVDALQADLDRQGAELLAARDALGEEHHEVRADERQRVLIALRAIRRQVADEPDAPPVLRELALRMDAVVARLDPSWTSGRPVPPLPTSP